MPIGARCTDNSVGLSASPVIGYPNTHRSLPHKEHRSLSAALRIGVRAGVIVFKTKERRSIEAALTAGVREGALHPVLQ